MKATDRLEWHQVVKHVLDIPMDIKRTDRDDDDVQLFIQNCNTQHLELLIY